MSKLKLPLPYISHSQFWLFENDPMEYYQQYFVCRIDEPTDKMILGKVFQEAWSDPKYPWRDKLKEAGFNGDKVRVIETALAHKEAVRLAKNKTEKRLEIEHPDVADYKLLSIMDGLELDIHTITENKMGKWWTQKTVEESTQITWYMMSYYVKYGKMPKLRLQSYNGNNGIPRVFWAKRTKADFDALITRINNMVTRIEAGDFAKY